eukprot:gene7822-10624_t
MDRRSDDYAGNQIRLLFDDLMNASHNNKLKAVKRFQSYIKEYQPDITDDSIDFLYSGLIDGRGHGMGLIYWSGVDSEKNNGQLKRICGPILNLMKWLITLPPVDEYGNIYYERFVHIPLSELMKMNFVKHIIRPQEKKMKSANLLISGQSKSSSSEDAFQIIFILVNDHRNMDDEDELVDASFLLNNNKECINLFNVWVQKQTSDHVNNTLAQYKGNKAKALQNEARASTWVDLKFKAIPLQEGEDGVVEINEDDNNSQIIPDPLGLTDIDLRSTQTLYQSGRLKVQSSGMYGRRSSMSNAAPFKSRRESQPISYESHSVNIADEEEEEDEEDDDDATKSMGKGIRHSKRSSESTSIIPSDKSFSPSFFLSLVHGNISFLQLQSGMAHLKQLLKQQSGRRENLVRMHFGLFVQCAEGLEWLKAFKKGEKSSLEKVVKPVNSTTGSTATNSTELAVTHARIVSVNDPRGEQKLRRAHLTLDLAKKEAKNTLAPILERMKQSRKVKSAEKVLKRMSSLLEYPYKMRLALDKGDYTEVISIYQRVKLVPSTSAFRIAKKVKESAELVIEDLKFLCKNVLLSPNSNHNTLLRLGKIVLELEGEQAYADILRQCYIRQILHFVESIRELRSKFYVDAVDAFKTGEEQNQNRISGDDSLRINVSDVRSSVKRRSTKVSQSGLGMLKREMELSDRSSSGVRQSSGMRAPRPISIKKSNSFWENDPYSYDNLVEMTESKGEFEFEDDDFEDYFPDGVGGIGGVNNDYDGDGLDLSSRHGSGVYYNNAAYFDSGFSFNNHSSHDALNEFALAAMTSDVDHSVFLSASVRLAYTENVVDLMVKWYPCLHRLSAELSNLANITTNTTLPLAKRPQINRANTSYINSSLKSNQEDGDQDKKLTFNTNRNNISRVPSRLLGASLLVCADMIRNLVFGIQPSFHSYNLPQDLMFAFTEMDSTNPTNANDVSSSVWNAVDTVLNRSKLNNDDGNLNASKLNDIFEHIAFMNPLQDMFLRSSLQEVFGLYDGIESIMNNHLEQTMKISKGGSGHHANTSLIISDFHYTSSTSSFHEGMIVLKELSIQGEIAVAQRFMTRLLELSIKLCSFQSNREGKSVYNEEPNGGKESNLEFEFEDNTHTAKAVYNDNHHLMKVNRIENIIKELEQLILRCMKKLSTKIKRPKWVSVEVQEGISRVFITFTESLRREALLIENAHAISNHSPTSHGTNPVNPGKKNRRKSSATTTDRLDTLEEELLNLEANEQIKHELLLDLLRSCVRLRTKTIPNVLNELLKLFPMDQDNVHDMSYNNDVIIKQYRDNTLNNHELNRPHSTRALNKLFGSSDSDATPLNNNNNNNIIDNKPKSIIDRNKANVTNRNAPLIQRLNDLIDLKLERFVHNLKEIILIEDRCIVSYCEMKHKELSITITAGYSLLVHKELSGSVTRLESVTSSINNYHNNPNKSIIIQRDRSDPSNNVIFNVIPTHLSRILLMIGNEKVVLTKELFDITVEYGIITTNYEHSFKSNSATILNKKQIIRNNKNNEYKNDDNMDDLNSHVEPVIHHLSLADTQYYSDHIFVQQCVGILEIYETLINKIKNSTLTGVDFSSNTISSSTCRTPYVLGQAIEEFEFFKTIFRPVLKSHPILVHPKLKFNEVTSQMSEQHVYLTSEELLKEGRLFSMMISNHAQEQARLI